MSRVNDRKTRSRFGAAADPPGTAARRAALGLLDTVLRKGMPIEAGQNFVLARLDRPEDRGLALAIATEALRRLPDLDALIDRATQRVLPSDAKARMVLRIALVQALILRTPPHAAISTALPLVESGPRRLVHGVFGALMRGGASLPEVPTLPAPVTQRWEQAWGADVAAAAARALAEPPPLDIAFPLGSPPALEGESFAPGHLRLPRGQAVSGMTGFGEGHWWVQDIAASIPARLLGAGAGAHVLDLCAAPGGKTMQLAAAGWRVTALDASESRLARLSDNLARTGLEAQIVAADLMAWEPDAPADAVLLDAPCTATGIFRRHPDVLHRVRAPAIAAVAEQQLEMLTRASAWVRPGGRLVYSVCSMEPEEGEEVVGRFLARAGGDYRVEPPAGDALPAGVEPTKAGWLRLLPGLFADQGGADSFFIAPLVRSGG